MTVEETVLANWSKNGVPEGMRSPPNSQPPNGRAQPMLAGTRPCTPKSSSVILQRILAPCDFSPASNLAIERAQALAHQCRAALTILHVVDIGSQSQAESAKEFMRRLWIDGSSQISQVPQRLGIRSDVQLVLEQGLPWEIIVEKSAFFDLIVLGASPKKRVKVFSRRTAERVLKGARCPVMVVNNQP